MKQHNLSIFASGNGSNAMNIIEYFKHSSLCRISAIFCNNPKAGIIEKAKKVGLETVLFTKEELNDSKILMDKLSLYNSDFIILAGFLLKIPDVLVSRYHNKIINIHPALLPKYGGKGMYGMHVHRAVINNNETESGITIHYVNENYDEGAIIFQAKCKVDVNDTAEDVAAKIHRLEMIHFPKVIEQLLLN